MKRHLAAVCLASACFTVAIGLSNAAIAQTQPTTAPAAATAPAAVAAPGTVTTPADHLGRPVGGDFTLADWKEVSTYYQKLAEQSPNVQLTAEGKTTEGRDLLLATISSPANLANLETLKQHARTIADPRGKSPEEIETALRDGKVFLIITPSMHSTEVGATQFGMEFSHLLATSDQEPWKSARENAVIFITPTLNPDGLDHICEWYRRIVGTPYESAGMDKLYQFYTGHDNNRDWFMLTQAETKILSRLMYKEINPQILWDVHQQGGGRERFFVPPYRDPLNPNLDPQIVATMQALGTRAVLDMTREGFTGIGTGSTYDQWWTGGNRSTPPRHNIVGILTEAASTNLASPVYLERSALRGPVAGEPYGPSTSFVNPWPGGWWRIRDIIDYELAFGRSLLGMINREPRMWLENKLDAVKRTIDSKQPGAKGWIIPSDNRDPTATRRMLDALMGTGVEVHVADGEIEIDGRKHPAGSIVIRRDQPAGNHVKDLFELQVYPSTRPPYDVAGWTMPLLMGVQRVEIRQSLEGVELKKVETSADATKAFAAMKSDAGLSAADSGSWTDLAAGLAEGRGMAFTGGRFAELSEEGKPNTLAIRRLPRIGIYSPHSGSMDEGWLRFVFDDAKIPFVSVKNEQIRAGNVSRFLDVLIIADTSSNLLDSGRAPGTVFEELTGGLSPEGTIALQEFVNSGGTLITFKNASRWAVKTFELPLTDVMAGEAAKEFSCPGSVLRGHPVGGHPLIAGLPETVPLFFAGATGWKEPTKGEKVQTLLRYAPTELLLSGYINQPQVLEGNAAWVRAEVGKGRVHLFGFQPHYRGWTGATIPLIFRAAFFEPMK